jgi:hypothetical protein
MIAKQVCPAFAQNIKVAIHRELLPLRYNLHGSIFDTTANFGNVAPHTKISSSTSLDNLDSPVLKARSG